MLINALKANNMHNMLNKNETTEYFRSLGLNLESSSQPSFRWKMKIPDGHGEVLHFKSLRELWNLVPVFAMSHFEQAERAKHVLDIFLSQSHPEWSEIDRWYHDKTLPLPSFVYEAVIARGRLPHNWKKAYKVLLEPYGQADQPLLGRILHSELLAYHQQPGTLCALQHSERNHAEHGDTGLGSQSA